MTSNGKKTKPVSPAPMHWRYISSFHGPWLQLPLEVLETLANANYYMPLPRPVDPSVFYDLVKIRQLVDGATDLAVRAANGVTSSSLSNSLAGGAAHHMQALGLGFGNNGGAKLSPERRFRMREQATQKLSRAYHLDEIASSVATMQSTSTLENVAGLVLQRAPDDPDAKYVHFFHEKIPSRQLAECTDLDALNHIINQRPSDCEPLRTRAIVRMFKEDFEGAVHDLTTALNVYRMQRPMHQQPPGDAMQLERNGVVNGDASSQDPVGDDPGVAPEEKGPTKKQLERRKIVRLYAKRALRDYMEYFKHFHYSPNLPIEISDDFTRQVNQATNRTKRYYNQQSRMASQDSTSPTGSSAGHTVYPLATLFSASPPADLPAYPSTDLVSASSALPEQQQMTTEVVTYHPLLIDALHSLLMCHTLIQTSAKELQRHAYMVARLARLADGYPVFQASRSPARADWIEVLRRAENWIELSASWETLCAPAPLPTLASPPGSSNGSGGSSSGTLSAAAANANAMALTYGGGGGVGGSGGIVKGSGGSGGGGGAETEDQRKERMRHQAILEALEDERVNDEASFKAAILARQRRAEADHAANNAATAATNAIVAAGAASTNGNGNNSSGNGSGAPSPTTAAAAASSAATPKRWAVVEGREYPILTERAEAVARWVREAPTSSGTGSGKRKKKTGAGKKSAGAGAGGAGAPAVAVAPPVVESGAETTAELVD
ncbi:putative histidine kinase group protein [Eutypa lata UCREL1]|uniref:Putative histidine kinase group protein n=1 Tax=Eutypa lata (strain UCR-EL1) TaxID=1287681 RepID=M7SJQ4_EUTLA|nr:putative histidine kinase group protein [Eutypa lata UCREL1]